MDGKKAALVAGLAAVLAVVWLAVRAGGSSSSDDRAGGASGARAASDRGAEPAGDRATGSDDDRARALRPPIHVAGGVEHDLADVPAVAGEPPPAPIDAAPAPSLADTFTAEPRDGTFAAAHEREIKRRVGPLASDGVTLGAIECRSTQCRIAVTAIDDAALGRFLGKLEEDEGLYGYAKLIVLEGVSDAPGGGRAQRIYARF